VTSSRTSAEIGPKMMRHAPPENSPTAIPISSGGTDVAVATEQQVLVELELVKRYATCAWAPSAMQPKECR
jgi:hypothetical protein